MKGGLVTSAEEPSARFVCVCVWYNRSAALRNKRYALSSYDIVYVHILPTFLWFSTHSLCVAV